MTDSNRGTCPVCGGNFQLTANGRIRSHGPREARCAGGSDLPAEQTVADTSPLLDGRADTEDSMADVDTPWENDPRPTASEYRAAEEAMTSPMVPGDVEYRASEVIEAGIRHGVRPDPEQHSTTTVAANGTPMTVHGGPNPHRAPLPTGPTPEQLAEMQARRAGGTAAELVRADSFGPAPVASPVFYAGFGSECAVCFGPISEGDEIRSTPDGYACAYHADVDATAIGSGHPRTIFPPEPAESFGPAPHSAAEPVATAMFDSAGPVSPPKVQADTAPHRVRKGPGKDDFDRWGRYKLPDPRTGETKGRQRVTTFAKMISDQYGLSRWQQRMLLKGAMENPQIVQQARGLDVKVNAATMDTVADALKDLAGDKVAAALGTEFHTLTEDYDLGRMTDLSQVPERHRGALVNYTETMRIAGLVSLPEFVERTTMVRSVDVAGTLDRILQLPNGDHVIGDVKTGQDLTYGWLDIGVQLSCYAHGVNENGVWDWDTRQWLPAPKVRTDYAIVMHAPAGSNICVLYRVDLTVGWANATLAAQVREARKYRRHSQLLALDGPEFVPSPGATAALEAAQGAVQSFGNAGVPAAPAPGTDAYPATDDAAEIANRRQAAAPLQVQPHTEVHVPTLQPEPTKPTKEPGSTNLLMKMALILDTDDAAEIYAEAVQAGAGPEGLAGLTQVGTDRLMRVAQAREAFAAVRTRQEAGGLYNIAVSQFGEYDPVIPALVATATATLDALNSPPF